MDSHSVPIANGPEHVEPDASAPAYVQLVQKLQEKMREAPDWTLRRQVPPKTEIRKFAAAVLQLLQMAAPHLFADYQLVPLPNGTL